jgi:LCP family protein required for cell wall assembly
LQRTSRVRPRARRSRYRFTHRLTRSVPGLIAIVLLVVVLLGASVAAVRVYAVLSKVTGNGTAINPVTIIGQAAEPPAGSIAYKLKHGQRINILLLGYGGSENDAPYLTDSIMVASVDPTTHRVMLTSVPRDLWVTIDAWPANHAQAHEKINAAFEAAASPGSLGDPNVLSDYRGRDGGGHMAEHVVGNVVGLKFDNYIAVDFKAFRDMVDALGGIQVCMDTKLDDYEYPNYHNGYIRGGIHFPAGCYQVNGEQALELARSRHAVQPEQSSDFGRARRQQMIMLAIKQKAVSVNGLAKAPQLMSALENDFKTDMSIADMTALYNWGVNLPESQIIRLALTASDFLIFGANGACAPPSTTSALCPEDPSYTQIRKYLEGAFVDPKVLNEKAPVQLANASLNSTDLGQRLQLALAPLGVQFEGNPVRRKYVAQSVIYDYSGGAFPQTAEWLSQYFGAPVQQVTPQTAPPVAGQATDGIVVVMGGDFAKRWYGLA